METKIGRPPKFTDAQALSDKIDAFFNDCDQSGSPYTITGLCLALDCEIETIRNYGEKDAFSAPIKKAYMKCQAYAEKQLFTARNPAGPIFSLKNYGWTDRQEIEHHVTSRTIDVQLLDSSND